MSRIVNILQMNIARIVGEEGAEKQQETLVAEVQAGPKVVISRSAVVYEWPGFLFSIFSCIPDWQHLSLECERRQERVERQENDVDNNQHH